MTEKDCLRNIFGYISWIASCIAMDKGWDEGSMSYMLPLGNNEWIQINRWSSGLIPYENITETGIRNE